MAESRLEEVETRLHCPLHELWGMTEARRPWNDSPLQYAAHRRLHLESLFHLPK